MYGVCEKLSVPPLSTPTGFFRLWTLYHISYMICAVFTIYYLPLVLHIIFHISYQNDMI